jgi:hypothetical protein
MRHNATIISRWGLGDAVTSEGHSFCASTLGDRILLTADFSELWTGGSSSHSVLCSNVSQRALSSVVHWDALLQTM